MNAAIIIISGDYCLLSFPLFYFIFATISSFFLSPLDCDLLVCSWVQPKVNHAVATMTKNGLCHLVRTNKRCHMALQTGGKKKEKEEED